MTKKRLLAAVITATLSSGMIASSMTSVFAADDSPTNTKAPVKEQVASEGAEQTTKTAEKDLVKVSEDARLSMRDVHTARLAIFNGQPGRARTYVDAAVTRIGAAATEAEKYALDIKAPKEDDRYVPFDANFTVLDTYEPTKDKTKHIAKANEHLHKGEQKKALKELKLGEIDVAISTELVPVHFAKDHIEQAAKLVSEGQYYEANLALKAVDDAVIVQTFATDETPKTKAETQTKD